MTQLILFNIRRYMMIAIDIIIKNYRKNKRQMAKCSTFITFISPSITFLIFYSTLRGGISEKCKNLKVDFFKIYKMDITR